ncbi:MAG: PEP-CTERM sorting domain-containing protein [Opitutales bacterium]
MPSPFRFFSVTNAPDTGITFNYGRLHVKGDVLADPGLFQDLNFPTVEFGQAGLQAEQHFSAAGTLTLQTSLTLQGGTLSFGRLENSNQLDWQTGTVNVTRAGGLEVGNDGSFGAVLTLFPQQTLNATADGSLSTVDPIGRLRLQDAATLSADGMTNNGEIQLAGSTARLTPRPGEPSGLGLTNNGLVRGEGRIDHAVTNNAGGELRADGGDRLVLTGDLSANSGTVNITDGGRLDVLGSLTSDGSVNVQGATLSVSDSATNQANGSLSVTNGSAFFNGGLTNQGDLVVGSDDADLYGDINNQAGARISAAGGATATLHDALTNNGEVVVTSGSRLVVLGDASGGGNYPGAGTVEFASGFSPGNSPGSVTFGGDVALQGTTDLVFEAASLAQGSSYDHIDVAGNLQTAGTLTLMLLDGFQPGAGDAFDLLDFGSLEGGFDTLNLPALDGGLSWDTSQLQAIGSLQVIPEPATTGLVLLGALGLVVAWRRRA